MKKMILGFIVLVVSVTLFAAPPASYYTNANGKTSDALRVALQDIIKGHTVVRQINTTISCFMNTLFLRQKKWE